MDASALENLSCTWAYVSLAGREVRRRVVAAWDDVAFASSVLSRSGADKSRLTGAASKELRKVHHLKNMRLYACQMAVNKYIAFLFEKLMHQLSSLCDVRRESLSWALGT